jgi:hypothetical protein
MELGENRSVPRIPCVSATFFVSVPPDTEWAGIATESSVDRNRRIFAWAIVRLLRTEKSKNTLLFPEEHWEVPGFARLSFCWNNLYICIYIYVCVCIRIIIEHWWKVTDTRNWITRWKICPSATLFTIKSHVLTWERTLVTAGDAGDWRPEPW